MASIAATMAGDRASSARLLDEARVAADGLDDLGVTLMTHQARALNGFLDGDPDAVGSAAAEGVRLSREAGDIYSLEMMLMNQGLAALMSGDLVGAGEWFVESLRIAQQLDDRVAQCYLIGGLGCCAAGLREPRLAAQLFGAMENLRTEVGATVNAGMARALARATTSVTVTLGPSTYASEFATGQEIGVRLFISERTVESHVRNSLNKLGFNSRAQIAGWMATPDR